MTDITTTDLTEASVTGSGVFDQLMKAAKAHLQEEYGKGRIKGPEYSSVYLGGLQSTMQYAVTFLLEKEKSKWQAELLQAQMETETVRRQVMTKEVEKLDKDILLVDAQIRKLDRENELLEEQRKKLIAETVMVGQQTSNLALESENIPKQGLLLDAQAANAAKENELMDKQICKLEAEFDVLMESKLKVIAEAELLNQKALTERAQTNGSNVDPGSVVGKQMALYEAQANGYLRDAEQKAAKILADTWNVRRTTDEAASANPENQLHDPAIGRVINRLLAGVQA